MRCEHLLRRLLTLTPVRTPLLGVVDGLPPREFRRPFAFGLRVSMDGTGDVAGLFATLLTLAGDADRPCSTGSTPRTCARYAALCVYLSLFRIRRLVSSSPV